MAATFSFGNFAQELTALQEEGVTFEDKTLTWDTAEDVKDVVDALNNTKVVHYLKLEGNTLGVDAAEAIGNALAGHPEFRKALWRNMFTRRLKTEIPKSLHSLGMGLRTAKARLTVLDLSDNALGPNGMVGLEELLRSEVVYTLQELYLNNCGLGIYGGKMLSEALIDCHRTSTAAGTPLRLRVFVAGRNRLENEGARQIAKMIMTLKTLEEVTMPQNSIYHEGIGALAEALQVNKELRVINLNDNTVTHRGAATLAMAFKELPKLEEINFGDCLLKTNGAYNFADALEDNHTQLRILDLSFNEIGADGGLSLVGALKNKPKLESVNLDGNQFGYDGRERIKEAMQETANPSALQEFEEDNSEGEEEEDEDDGDEDDHSEDVDENEEDYIYDEALIDTTEEVDYEEEANESAYTTTQAFTTKMFSGTDSFQSSKSVSFTEKTGVKTAANPAEAFCLSQQACTLEMFEALPAENRLESLLNVINLYKDDHYWIILAYTSLKLAHLSKSSPAALDMAIALNKEIFDKAAQKQQEKRILKFYLIQLGLLSTTEKFNSPYNKEHLRFALRETLKKDQLSSENVKNSFQILLQKVDT